MSKFGSSFSSITCKSVTLVPRVTIKWPARMDVVDYFHKQMNLVEEGLTLEDMNWNHTQTWLVPAVNEFCLKRLAKNAIQTFENDILHNGIVLKVEFFNPNTHELVVEASA